MTAVFQQATHPTSNPTGLGVRLVRRVAAACLAGFLGLSPVVFAKGPVPGGGLPTMKVSEMPKQGQETYEKILQGGPFPYDKDGTVFGNRERILPGEKRGYYREYTVKTPGSRDRGARRIVCGGKPTTPDACYYTADHYSSFKRIAQ